MNFIKRNLDYIWPAVGFVAVIVSFFWLYEEFRGQSLGPHLIQAFSAISPGRYFMALVSTVVAYVALAFYDRIALLHLGVKNISWRFVAACSFTTYALSHNIGASVLSGAMVRYRGYSSKGLSAAQIAVLVAVCSLTFALGAMLVGGVVLIVRPQSLAHIADMLPHLVTDAVTARIIGAGCLALVAAYCVGSILRLPSTSFFGVKIEYPHWGIVLRQLIVAPAEIIGAAAIIYYVLPTAGNPGFIVVLAAFIFAFSAALASNAPGGLGVFELVFLKAMPGAPADGVLAALLLFRLLYLVIPLVIAVFVVLAFEKRRLAEAIEHHHHMAEEEARTRSEHARPE